MAHTEGKNKSFLAKDKKNLQNCFFSMTLSSKGKGHTQIYDCYVHVYMLSTVTVFRGTHWVP